MRLCRLADDRPDHSWPGPTTVLLVTDGAKGQVRNGVASAAYTYRSRLQAQGAGPAGATCHWSSRWLPPGDAAIDTLLT